MGRPLQQAILSDHTAVAHNGWYPAALSPVWLSNEGNILSRGSFLCTHNEEKVTKVCY
jgi:hypothetical protein